jgi:hypothetical protein
MIADATREIRERSRRAQWIRQQRQRPASLTQAEEYAHQVEELVVDGARSVPERQWRDIRRFVMARSTALGRRMRLRDRQPVAVLDVLFDVQEVLQRQRVALQ